MVERTIRPARAGDFEAVVRMIAELMTFQGLEGGTPVEAAVLERDVLQNGHPSVAVAEESGKLVGYVLYFRPIPRATGVPAAISRMCMSRRNAAAAASAAR